MKKAKSSSALLISPADNARRGRIDNTANVQATRPFNSPFYASSTAQSLATSKLKSSNGAQSSTTFTDDSWLHRAGLVIASEARDTKGQGWLASKASSTSLNSPVPLITTAATEPAHAVSQRVAAADDPPTPRWPSRVGSRAHSRAHSRRGSQARIALTPFLATTASAAGPISSSSTSNTAYPFYEEALALEEQEDSTTAHRERTANDEEEAEVAALAASSRSFVGLTWLDRLVGGWTLFPHRGPTSASSQSDPVRGRWINDYDYEASSSSDDEDEDSRGRTIGSAGEGEALRAMEYEIMRRRRAMDAEALQKLRVNVAAEEDTEGGDEKSERGKGEDEVPAWRDAAWLLGVAARVMFS